MDSLNAYIDDACKDALVDIVSGHLVCQYGARAMELYIASPGDVDDDALEDLVERTIDKRALPLASTVSRSSKRSRRFSSGPRKTSDGTLRRIVLPMFTWDYTRISPHLSKICPRSEDQIDKTVPGAILNRLADRDEFLITFDQNDVISRLQPEQDARYFPWEDELEWQTALGDSSVAKVYLDVVYETIQRGKLDSESEVRDNTYLADQGSRATPLAKMFNALNLPPNLRQQEQVSLLHPELQDHRLLKRKAWRPKPYRLEDFLDRIHLETALHEERALFWNWLRDNWRTVKSRKILNRIADLPVWPNTKGDLLPLDDLCEPDSAHIATIIGGAIMRPSRELLKTGIATRTGRGRLTIRNTPSLQELEEYLANQIDRFPRGRKLTADEGHEFHKFEKQLAILATSIPRLREYLVELGGAYGVALDMAGTLRMPGELARAKGALQRLCLLNEYLIDRPNSILDRIDSWKPRTAPSTSQIVDTFRRDGSRLDAHVPRLQAYLKQSRREGADSDSLLDVPCIPVDGELRTPSQLALPGTPDYWGDWKLRVSVDAVNPETQELYKLVGVTGSTPDSTNSRRFFQWLACQDTEILLKHAEHALRHISHKSGPRTWHVEFPQVPFIMVTCDRDRLRLVTQADATARRSKVVIPDFEELEEAIKQDRAESPVEIAVIEHPRVTKPVTAHLRELGLQTLSDYAGDPIRVVGNGPTALPLPSYQFNETLNSLNSGLKGKELHKRLASLDLDTPESSPRSNWRERLRAIQGIRTAESVVATYGLGRRRFSILVDGKLDKDSGVLWLNASADLRKMFFDAIAQHIFATPKKYHGLVLDEAYRRVVTQRHPEEYTDVNHHREDIDVDETVNHREADPALVATSARHSAAQRDRSRNVPRPGPIPQGTGAATNVSVARKASGSRANNRAVSADENAQVADLKEKQYAWHCQACLAEADPKTLAPKSSYVEHADDRRQLMKAHHPDHVNAGGVRHAGNILLLCHYHHGELGDAVTRTEITRSLDQATTRRLTFNSDNGVSNSIQGKLVNVRPPQRQNPVSLFFTREHADYWLRKATEEGLR